MRYLVITVARGSWTDGLVDLTPGAHAAVFADDQADLVGIAGRMVGLELRDTLVVLRPGPRLSLLLLFRKPVEEATVIAQVLRTGTGGLNLDACRVESSEAITTHSRGHTTASPATRDKSIEEAGEPMLAIHFHDANGIHTTVTGAEHLVRGRAAKIQGEGLLYASLPVPWGRKRQDEFERKERFGRWPPNLLIVHGPECVRAGTRRVVGSNAPGRKSQGIGERGFGFGAAPTREGRINFYTDPNDYGMETVTAWECAPGCPAVVLDAISGDRPVSGRAASGQPHAGSSEGYEGGWGNVPRELPNDVGGASRFFPQFKDEAELHAWVERLITPV